MNTVSKPKDAVHDDVWDTFFAGLCTTDRSYRVEHINSVLEKLYWSEENKDHDEAKENIRDLLLIDDNWLIHTVYSLVGVADWEPTERFRKRIHYYLTDRLGREPPNGMEQAICDLTAGITNWIATARYNDRASQTG